MQESQFTPVDVAKWAVATRLCKNKISINLELLKQGDANELNNLGTHFFRGCCVAQDYCKAIECYLLASKTNNPNACANLGVCYYYGNGTQQDYKTALYYFKECVYSGHADEFPESYSNSLNHLGAYYMMGRIVRKNIDKAFELFLLASKCGNTNALNNVGDCYFFGKGVNINYTKAYEYYLQSACDNSNAQYSLGCCYIFGNGCAINVAEGLKYLQLSVKQNNVFAKRMMYRLVCIYLK